jgi:hypothetical protein
MKQRFIWIHPELEGAFEFNCARESLCFVHGTPEACWHCWTHLDNLGCEHAICSEHTAFIAGIMRRI